MSNCFLVSMAVDVLIQESLWQATIGIQEFGDPFCAGVELFRRSGAENLNPIARRNYEPFTNDFAIDKPAQSIRARFV